MEGQDFDKALGCIISTLIALAALAERASGARYPVRCLVLLLLKTAEGVASRFVHEFTEIPPGIVDLDAFPYDDDWPGNDCARLLRLAMRFRVLAAMLGQMLYEPWRFEQDIYPVHADARPVVRYPNKRALSLPGSACLPGSRAPPSRFQKDRKARLWS